MTLKDLIDEALDTQQLANSIQELTNVVNDKQLGQKMGLKLNAGATPQFQQLAKQMLEQKKKELLQAQIAAKAQKEAAAKAQMQNTAMQANGGVAPVAGQTVNGATAVPGQTAN